MQCGCHIGLHAARCTHREAQSLEHILAPLIVCVSGGRLEHLAHLRQAIGMMFVTERQW